MATPQQPELRRSGDNALQPGGPDDAPAHPSKPDVGGTGAPVPEDNLPGHHPADEQDKPDPDDFVAKARQVATRRGTATPKNGPAKNAPAKEAPAAAGPAPAASTSSGGTHPLVAVAQLQWKVATFPIRVAIGAVGRIRRLL
ncbi:MAG: hypothetical protein WD232_07270 [Acidimicrobiales bacterium]